MRKSMTLILIILYTMFAAYNTSYARAGGGDSSSNTSNSNSESNESSNYYSDSCGSGSVLSNFINMLFFTCLLFETILVFKAKMFKAKIKTKLMIKKNKLNYRQIIKRIIKTYFVVQKAWANENMALAKDYMDKDLLEQFESKINRQKYCNRKNVMKNIKLLDAYPISISYIEDFQIWVYIKGKMIDYILDLNSNEIVSGNNVSKSFVEYWCFSKNENNQWVLSKILQKNEYNKILY